MFRKLLLAVLVAVIACSSVYAQNNKIALNKGDRKKDLSDKDITLRVQQTSSVVNIKYKIVDLGAIVRPIDVNNSGEVVGTTIGDKPEGVIWRSGALVKLAVDGFEKIMPRAINDSGIIAGAGFVAGGLVKPILYENGKITVLADKGNCSNINSLGIAIGSKSNSDGSVDGILWNKDSSVDCGNLGGVAVLPRGINVSCEIVGFADSPKNFQNAKGEFYSCKKAFVYTVRGISELGTLGGNRSYAKSINTSGTIIGASEIEIVEPFSAAHAFVWKDNIMTDLGTLGGMFSEACDINDRGQIVGNSSINNSKVFRAVIWEDLRITDLNSLIPEGSGWQLNSANSINNNGWIAGSGNFEGKYHGFLLIPIQTDSQPENDDLWRAN